MATFKELLTVTMDAASNTSLTSAFEIPTEFNRFALEVPASSGWCITATVNVRLQQARSAAGTYRNVYFSQNPTTATSGNTIWEATQSVTGNGGFVIGEVFSYAKYCKLQFTRTATAAATFVLYGGKDD